MPTYTKETALFDTGKIGGDIASAGQTASKYITAVDQNGISVHAENNTNVNYTIINAEGMEVFDDSTSVAKFGAVTRVGTEADASITINDESIIRVGEDGKNFFNFSNSDATVDTVKAVTDRVRMIGYPTSESNARTVGTSDMPTAVSASFSYPTHSSRISMGDFTVGTASTKTKSFTYDGVSYTFSVKYDGAKTFKSWLNPHSSSQEYIYFNCSFSRTMLAPSYEIGTGAATGGYALAEGFGTTASGNYSHAEGFGTIASGLYAHAEGEYTIASQSHSHAEGYNTVASGNYSHAQNYLTIAAGDCQTAVGKYNASDTTSIFVIGNGASGSNRSNALTVDWNGNVDIASGAKYKINGTALAASDVGAVPTTRTVNSKTLSADITLDASDVSAVPTSRTVNGKALSADVADADYVTSQGTSGNWEYRKWNSGKVELWLHETNATLAINSAVGNMYQSSSNITRTVPSAVTLTSVLYSNVNIKYGSYSVWTAVYGCTTSTLTFRPMSALSRASTAGYTIDAYIVGQGS